MAGLGSLFSGVIEGYKGVSGILDNVEAQAWHGEYMKAWRESRDKLKSRETQAEIRRDVDMGVGKAVAATPDVPPAPLVPPKPTSAAVGSTPKPPALPAPSYPGTAPGSGTMATGGAAPAAVRAQVPESLLTPEIPAVSVPAHTALDRALNYNTDVFTTPAPIQVDQPVVQSPSGGLIPAKPLAGVGSTIGGAIRETIEQSPRTGFYNTVDAMGRGLGRGIAAIPGVIQQQLTQPRQLPRAIDPSVPNYIPPPTTSEYGYPVQVVPPVDPRNNYNITPRAIGRLF